MAKGETKYIQIPDDVSVEFLLGAILDHSEDFRRGATGGTECGSVLGVHDVDDALR
jgi:hypothetical protein